MRRVATPFVLLLLLTLAYATGVYITDRNLYVNNGNIFINGASVLTSILANPPLASSKSGNAVTLDLNIGTGLVVNNGNLEMNVTTLVSCPEGNALSAVNPATGEKSCVPLSSSSVSCSSCSPYFVDVNGDTMVAPLVFDLTSNTDIADTNWNEAYDAIVIKANDHAGLFTTAPKFVLWSDELNSWAHLEVNYLYAKVFYDLTDTNYYVNPNYVSRLNIVYVEKNLGIGTTSPSERLDVNGNILASGYVKGSQLCIGDDCRSAWPSGIESVEANPPLVSTASGSTVILDLNYNTTHFTVSNGALALTTPYATGSAYDSRFVNVDESASGDIEGNFSSGFTVIKIQGQPISSTSPTAGQVLKWNGTEWAPATDEEGITSITANAPLTSTVSGSSVTLDLNVGAGLAVRNGYLEMNAISEVSCPEGNALSSYNPVTGSYSCVSVTGTTGLTSCSECNDYFINVGESAGGDLSGTYPNPTVSGLLGYSLPSLSTGALYWNGTAWTFQTVDTNPSDDVTSVSPSPPISASVSNGTLYISLNVGTGLVLRDNNLEMNIVTDINCPSGYALQSVNPATGEKVCAEINTSSGTPYAYTQISGNSGSASAQTSSETLSVVGSGPITTSVTDSSGSDTLTIDLNYGNGLGLDASNNLEVKLGTGLTYDASGNIAVNFGSSAGTVAEGSKTITISAGTGLTGGGTVTIGAGGTVTLSLSHPSLSCTSGVMTGFDLNEGTVSCEEINTGIAGSGDSNYIPKFTGSTTLGNSQIYDNGTNVGIGTTSPSERLEVAGNIKASKLIDRDNTSYYLDPSGTSELNSVNVTTLNGVPSSTYARACETISGTDPSSLSCPTGKNMVSVGFDSGTWYAVCCEVS